MHERKKLGLLYTWFWETVQQNDNLPFEMFYIKLTVVERDNSCT